MSVNDLLDRLNQWASSLPPSEPIPITDAEAFQLAIYAEAQSQFHGENSLDADRAAATLETILAGRFIFLNHRVVVL